MKKIFIIAIRNLIKNKSRTLILATAIASTAMMLSMITAVTSGIDDYMFKVGTRLFTGHLNVGGFYKMSSNSAAPIITDLNKLYKIVNDNFKDQSTLIVDRVRAFGKLISDSSSIDLPITGIDINKENDLLTFLSNSTNEEYKGSTGDFSLLSKSGYIAIFETVAKKLKIAVGDTVTMSVINTTNTSNTKDLKVCAVLKDMGSISLYTTMINSEDAKDVNSMKKDSSGFILIYLKSIKNLKKDEDRLRKLIADAGYDLMEQDGEPYFFKFDKVANQVWYGQKIDITNWEDELSFVKWVTVVFKTLGFILTLIVLTIIAIGIINALSMSVRERTSEIGSLRAIGMRRKKIILMFMTEATILSLASVSIGILLCLIIGSIVNSLNIELSNAFRYILFMDKLYFYFTFSNLLITFVTINFFTIIAALLPSYKASKLKPITAINHNN